MESAIAQITSKGQVTIPRAIRDALGLDQGDQVVFVQEGERAILIPLRQQRLADLRGALPAGQTAPGIAEMRQAAREELGQRIAEGKE